MLRKIMIVLAMALAFGGTMPATTAFARGGGGGGGGHMGGGGGHMGGGMGGAHFGGSGGFGGGGSARMGGSFGGLGRGGVGGGHFGGGHFDGGRGRFARGFHRGFGGFGLVPYDDYGYDYSYGDCYQTQRYHTRTGWHTRRVYVCG